MMNMRESVELTFKVSKREMTFQTVKQTGDDRNLDFVALTLTEGDKAIVFTQSPEKMKEVLQEMIKKIEDTW